MSAPVCPLATLLPTAIRANRHRPNTRAASRHFVPGSWPATGLYGLRYIASMRATEFFSALANDTRLRCLALLSRHAELCVCELTHALGASQPHISRHLGQLRELGIVTDRRAGLWVYYRINPALPSWAAAVIEQTTSGTAGSSPFAEDEARLAAMANRPGAARCA